MAKPPEATPPKRHPDQKFTTIVFHRNDDDTPIIHTLQGLWADEALLGVLEPLVNEYFDENFDSTCEILWQEGEVEWGEEINLVLNFSRD